jgi:hypothetical protein
MAQECASASRQRSGVSAPPLAHRFVYLGGRHVRIASPQAGTMHLLAHSVHVQGKP